MKGCVHERKWKKCVHERKCKGKDVFLKGSIQEMDVFRKESGQERMCS